ncbi:MAG: two-component regulator propeller domain-containing protein [Bacteroidota bacterium]
MASSRPNCIFPSFIAFLLTIWVGMGGSAFAQSYQIQPYAEEQGLLDKYIYTINQDDRGFLYVGTGEGLYRFNGATFDVYRSDSTELTEDFVTSSFKDEGGRIWLGHFEGGISIVEQQTVRSTIPREVLNSRISGFGQDQDGNVWVASQRNGLVRIARDLQYEHFPDALAGSIVTAFVVTDENQVLVGTDEGLKILVIEADGPPRFSHDVDSVPLTAVQCITPHYRRDGFWLGTQDEGLLEYIPGTDARSDQVSRVGPSTVLAEHSIRSIFEDAEENVWIGTQNHGLLKFNDQDVGDRLRLVTPTPNSDTLGACQVECMFVDRYGQLWMGIYNRGLVCMSEETFARYQMATPSSPAAGSSVTLEDHEGNLWVGTEQGLFMIERSRLYDNALQYSVGQPLSLPHVRHLTTEDGLPADQVTALYEDGAHTIWIGTKRNGVVRLDADRKQITPLDLNSISLSKAINAINADSSGNVWVATNDGAFVIPSDTAASTKYFSTRNGLAHNNIYDIYPDSKGRVWLATHTNNVTIYDGNRFEALTVAVADEIPNINCIVEDQDGNIWLGTDGLGLYKYDNQGFVSYTENQGLLSNYCYQIELDGNNSIWIAHRNGVSRYIPETGVFNRYPNKESFDFEENPILSSERDRRGNVWFASPRGLIKYTREPLRSRLTEPYTFIQSVKIGGKASPLDGEELELPYDVYRIEFRFLGLTFLDQAAVKYEYKLEGRDQDWSSPTTDTRVMLQGIGEGEYTFLVRACNVFGVCNEKPVAFAFRVSVPFWQTWWFRLLIVFLLGGLVFLYVRYRVYRLNRQKEELEQLVSERTEEIRLKNLELAKLSLVASETDNAVFILDAEGNLEYINPGFTRLTGYTQTDIVRMRQGKNFLDTSTNPEIRRLVEKVTHTNSSAQYESQLPARDGRTIWVISTMTPILDENGQLSKIVVIDSDITEQKIAEDKIRQMNAALEGLVAERTQELKVANQQLQVENEEHVKTAQQLRVINQELDNFVYRASHDLKGPLASILGLVNIASIDLGEDETARRYLQLIDQAARKLDVILVDLIEATQVKQGKIEFSKLKPYEVTSDILESLANKQGYPEHKFVIEIDPDLEIISDRRLLSSILQNFIDNSVKYRDTSKAQCTTWINLELKSDRTIDIKVRDNGIGIKDELKNRVFDMFFRGTNQAGGSGLGLYIVKQAAEKMKGTIDMESQYGEGTTFMAFVPNRSEADIVPEEAASEAPV